MITHADYASAYPLPSFPAPLLAPSIVHPVAEGRVHKIASRADAAITAVRNADYIAILRRDAWIDSARISVLLDVSQGAAKNRMRSPEIAELVETRRVNGRYEWRLL